MAASGQSSPLCQTDKYKVKTLCLLLAFAFLNDVRRQPLAAEISPKNKTMEQWGCTPPHFSLLELYMREMAIP